MTTVIDYMKTLQFVYVYGAMDPSPDLKLKEHP
jgi:hypothetical protein